MRGLPAHPPSLTAQKRAISQTVKSEPQAILILPPIEPTIIKQKVVDPIALSVKDAPDSAHLPPLIPDSDPKVETSKTTEDLIIEALAASVFDFPSEIPNISPKTTLFKGHICRHIQIGEHSIYFPADGYQRIQC